MDEYAAHHGYVITDLKHKQHYMKNFLVILCPLFFCASLTQAQDTIRIEDIAKHKGDSVTVCAKVYGGIFLDKGKNQPTFLNLGAPYPNHLLTVVIWKTERHFFKKPPETALINREICITGRVIDYNSKPEIVFRKPEQMTIR